MTVWYRHDRRFEILRSQLQAFRSPSAQPSFVVDVLANIERVIRSLIDDEICPHVNILIGHDGEQDNALQFVLEVFALRESGNRTGERNQNTRVDCIRRDRGRQELERILARMMLNRRVEIAHHLDICPAMNAWISRTLMPRAYIAMIRSSKLRKRRSPRSSGPLARQSRAHAASPSSAAFVASSRPYR